MANVWVSVGNFEIVSERTPEALRRTTRFLSDAAAELPGYLHHHLFRDEPGSTLVCVAAFSIERSARTFCRAISDGREQLAASYGSRLRDVSVMRELVDTDLDAPR